MSDVPLKKTKTLTQVKNYRLVVTGMFPHIKTLTAPPPRTTM